MSIDVKRLGDLPSPFYRVTVKALIFDEQDRLLVYKNHNGYYEIPGGGWEYGESFEDGMQRELAEELGVQALHISKPVCFWLRRHKDWGFMMLRIGAYVTLKTLDFTETSEHDKVCFVTQDALMTLDLETYEGNIKEQAAIIWDKANRSI